MIIRSEKDIIHPIIFEPIKKYIDEKFLPVSYEMYPGILPGYLISNYGTVFNLYTGEYINWHLCNKGYPRVNLLFFRNGKVINIEKAVDRIVLNVFDYTGIYDDNEFKIMHKDRDQLNCHFDNLYLYDLKESYKYKKKNKCNRNITYNELKIH